MLVNACSTRHAFTLGLMNIEYRAGICWLLHVKRINDPTSFHVPEREAYVTSEYLQYTEIRNLYKFILTSKKSSWI
jgi:hypothetical protein